MVLRLQLLLGWPVIALHSDDWCRSRLIFILALFLWYVVGLITLIGDFLSCFFQSLLNHHDSLWILVYHLLQLLCQLLFLACAESHLGLEYNFIIPSEKIQDSIS